jgi:hypothetical protein
MNDLLEKILSGVLTIALFTWIWMRSTAQSDKLEKRVAEIEKNGMTREEFLRGLNDWSQGRREMHAENQACLREIRDDIKENEKRRSHTEHAILDVVNELRLKNAATEAVEKYKDARNDR